MRILLSLVLALCAVSLSAQPSGLIAHYPFEGNGKDLSGNGHDAVPFGNLKYEPGIVGQAAVFDGKTTFFEILPNGYLPEIGDFTITTWVFLKDYPLENAGKSGEVRSYIFNGHSGYRLSRTFYRPGFSMILDRQTDGREEFHNFMCSSVINGYGNAEQSIACKVKGFWRCVTFVRSGDELITYVDGEELENRFVARRSHVGTDLIDMNHHWYIGTFSGNNPHYYRNNGITYNFKGLLDEMRIFNRALSANEVRNICNIYAR
ncbi:LamG domain-containing protein [Neolewinella persica]|uniref:LamG domain-containing protein n=1 Tax=Neolewinella persica TaxID=70998 RepID=UPI000381B676|nr:LamG domain-containing protein [Neolewinella persica]